MTMQESTMWGIHGGRDGEADDLFLKAKCVALGWPELGDLGAIAADRDGFKEVVAQAYPEAKPGAIPNYAGQLFRFVHEMRVDDVVVYPSRRDRQIHIGVVVGPYKYDASQKDYPNRRAVRWLCARPRTYFSQGALYELGSAMSFFQVRNYTEDIRAALEAKPEPPVATSKDETIALVADDIEQTARDFVIKTLAEDLKGHPFAHFVAHLLEAMGYRCRTSPEGPDGGVDIVAHRDELGFEPPVIKVQVKSSEGTQGDPGVSSLYGKVGPGEYGLFVTLGTFTAAAKTFARGRTNLRLIDGYELVELIFAHYEQFDSTHKRLLPLRRAYIPAPIGDRGE